MSTLAHATPAVKPASSLLAEREARWLAQDAAAEARGRAAYRAACEPAPRPCEALASYEPTPDDLALLHGDDHDGQFCPEDVEYWSQRDADYWQAEYELAEEANLLSQEREAEIAYREACTYRGASAA